MLNRGTKAQRHKDTEEQSRKDIESAEKTEK
jgi:hypothetical protein